MRRIDPTFPDLLPVTYRLENFSQRVASPLLDLATMRLVRQGSLVGTARNGHYPRRPVRVLAHAGVVKSRKRILSRLFAAGCGVLLVLDEPLVPEDIPSPLSLDQVTIVNVWVANFWGDLPALPLSPFREVGYRVGTVVALAPQLPFRESMAEAIETAVRSRAEFVVLVPLLLTGEEKHQAYERAFGEEGNQHFEDLLFHLEAGEVAKSLEVLGSVLAHDKGLREGLPGPSTALSPASTFAGACSLLLWARRLDLLDGVSSQGWRLRRAAQGLLASGRDPRELMEEDNLRLIPGFDPWVEAFARSLWVGEGEPFASIWLRWLEQAS